MNYRPKHFRLEELVDPHIYQARGARAWELLRPDALISLDLLRMRFGPLIVNDWHGGGRYSESGLRRFDTDTGAKWSMHKYGAAFDCKFVQVSSQEVHAYVLANADEFPQITVLEDIAATPTWLHFDVRISNREGIWVVNP